MENIKKEEQKKSEEKEVSGVYASALLRAASSRNAKKFVQLREIYLRT